VVVDEFSKLQLLNCEFCGLEFLNSIFSAFQFFNPQNDSVAIVEAKVGETPVTFSSYFEGVNDSVRVETTERIFWRGVSLEYIASTFQSSLRTLPT
jgi:hypothetical protein